jgi:hypothetical protein
LKKLTTGFKTTGAAYPESIELLLYLSTKHDWLTVCEEVVRDNLLKKKSGRWIGHLVRFFNNRYVVRHAPLPKLDNLSAFVSKVKSPSARIQVLYQYVCESDPFVDLFVKDLVAKKIGEYGSFILTRAMFEEFLTAESQVYPEIKKWSLGTTGKLRRDLFAFLRSSGLMEKNRGITVRKFVVKPEVFAFFLFGLISIKLDTPSILKSYLWDRYFLAPQEIDALLADCQVRGWLQYRNFGGISELIPRFKSLEEWLIALE